jgi:hypothetical protein
VYDNNEFFVKLACLFLEVFSVNIYARESLRPATFQGCPPWERNQPSQNQREWNLKLLHAEAEMLRFVTFNFEVVISVFDILFRPLVFCRCVEWNSWDNNGDHYVYFIKQENVVPCTQSLINSWNIFSYFFLILFKWVNMWG